MTITSQRTARPMPDRNAFEDINVTQQYPQHHPNRSYRHSNSDAPLPPYASANPNDASRLSTSSISSSNSTTINRLSSTATSNENAVTVVVDLPPPLSPKLVCPPTPVRIHPMFRVVNSNDDDVDDDNEYEYADAENEPQNPFSISASFYPEQQLLRKHPRIKLERCNSLIATKIIATCSPQLLLHNTTTNSSVAEESANTNHQSASSSWLRSTETTTNTSAPPGRLLHNTATMGIPSGTKNVVDTATDRSIRGPDPALTLQSVSSTIPSVAINCTVVAPKLGEPLPPSPKLTSPYC